MQPSFRAPRDEITLSEVGSQVVRWRRRGSSKIHLIDFYCIHSRPRQQNAQADAFYRSLDAIHGVHTHTK